MVDEERGRGRPTHLTIDLVYKIAKKVKSGVPPNQAAAEMGVVRRNYLNWMTNGRQDQQLEQDSVYRELLEQIEVARAEFIATIVDKTINKLDSKFASVKDGMLILERSDPENFRKRESIDLSGSINARVQSEQLTSAEDEKLRIARTLGFLEELGYLNPDLLIGGGSGRIKPEREVVDAEVRELVAHGTEEADSITQTSDDEVHPPRPEREADSLSESD